MIVYLAGLAFHHKNWDLDTTNIHILSSFWEHRTGRYPAYVGQDRYILDSGAFSAFSGKNNDFDWDTYVTKYADFIIRNKVKLFFELDIDVVVGLERVERYRKYLEERTGIKPIPVWHANRGKDYFIKMCEDYPYVAIGTTTTMNEGKRIRKNPMILKWFIDEAHKKGAKIHGLGFTDTKFLPYLKFDSVDSTSWLAGGRYGHIYKFNNGTMTVHSPPKGKRAKSHTIVNPHNFNEWLKYQEYAEKHL